MSNYSRLLELYKNYVRAVHDDEPWTLVIMINSLIFAMILPFVCLYIGALFSVEFALVGLIVGLCLCLNTIFLITFPMGD